MGRSRIKEEKKKFVFLLFLFFVLRMVNDGKRKMVALWCYVFASIYWEREREEEI